MRPKISVVINTRNEEKNLPYALRSVASWASEIVVVDMESTDDTLRIARSFNAKVFSVDPVGYADPARAFAIAQATGDWVLVLDADELVPEPLSQRLLEIASEGSTDIVMCHFRTFLLGTALEGTGWGLRHEVHPRFFRNGYLEFRPEVHSRPVPKHGSRVLDLAVEASSPSLAIQHFNYLGFHDFVDRLNRYTSIEARQAFDRDEAPSIIRGFTRAGREFLWRFFRARGFRDGWRGIHLSVLMAMYRLVVSAKQHQLGAVGSEDRIEALYAAEAERFLSAYPKDGSRAEDTTADSGGR